MPLYGPRWPLSSGENDAFEMYDDVKKQISFYLKCLLLTSPGENISDPDYGVGLRSYLFEPNNDSIKGTISSKIQNQISRYLNYLQVSEISVDSSSSDIDSNSLNIKIVYYIPKNTTQEVFELNLNPDTNIGFY